MATKQYGDRLTHLVVTEGRGIKKADLGIKKGGGKIAPRPSDPKGTGGKKK